MVRVGLLVGLGFGLVLAPSAHAQDCVAPDELSDVAVQAVLLITDEEMEEAQRVANQALRGLACLEEVPSPEDLASLWQVIGAAGVYQGIADLAEPNLRQAAAVHPGWFNDRLGQEARERWQAAAMSLGEPAEIAVSPVPSGALLYLNGIAREQAVLDLLPGQHLVQITWRDEVAFNRVLDLAPGQEAAVATGLPAPEAIPETGEPEPSRRYLVFSGISAAGAVAAFTGGLLVDGRISNQDSLEGLNRTWWMGHALAYGVGGALAGTAAVGVGLHIRQ